MTTIDEMKARLAGMLQSVWIEDVERDAIRTLLAHTADYDALKGGLEQAAGAAMAEGWNACRRSIYAVCEDAAREGEGHRSDTENAPRHHFGRGQMSAAKSIARGFNSMEARDDDNFTAALSAFLDREKEVGRGLKPGQVWVTDMTSEDAQ